MNNNLKNIGSRGLDVSRIFFYGTWLVLAVIQACFTELQDDEAYYWVYSRFPSWGYFDHPPLTGILIKAGYAVFENECGVRLLFVLMNLATIYLTEKMVGHANRAIFLV